MELNSGPLNEYWKSVTFISPTNSVCLLEFRLSQLGRTALDVGGGGDCFFRAVLHQLYLHSVGIQQQQQQQQQTIGHFESPQTIGHFAYANIF